MLFRSTRAGYDTGCRCDQCSAAHRRACKDYRLRAIRAGGSTLVPAADVLDDLRGLTARASFSSVARAIGTSHSWVIKVLNGDIRRINPRHAETIRRLAAGSFVPDENGHMNPIGAVRRLRALVAIGWSLEAVAREGNLNLRVVKDTAADRWPVIEARTHRRIVAVYDRLSMTPPNPMTNQAKGAATRARARARAAGWAPPLAWDNIDDPNERPKIGDIGERYHDSIDEVVVERVLSGEWHLRASRAEREEITRRWIAAGGSIAELCRRTGWQEGRYVMKEAS